MTFRDAQLMLKKSLAEIYDTREAAVIADWVLEKITGLKKVDRLVNREAMLPEEYTDLLQDYIDQLMAHRPVQYVLQEADFCGLRLYVDENVLIPRPETEELVAWILEDQQETLPAGSTPTRLFDIGTGSGAIPIALKHKNPSLQVTACDVSEAALQVARRNANTHKAAIEFIEVDILNQGQWPQLPVYDIIVSNPPYIPEADKISMSENVLGHEPHLALFTPGDNAFVFYQAIAAFGKTHLSSDGKLFFEIHHEGTEAVHEILTGAGYRDIEAKNDLFGNPRMIKALR